MGSCCHDKGCALDALRERQGRTLRIVLAINVVLFLVEFGAGIVAASTSLMADSLDSLGDALVYAVSLYVLSRSERWRAGAAMLGELLEMTSQRSSRRCGSRRSVELVHMLATSFGCVRAPVSRFTSVESSRGTGSDLPSCLPECSESGTGRPPSIVRDRDTCRCASPRVCGAVPQRAA
jgi:hypothetical protein